MTTKITVDLADAEQVLRLATAVMQCGAFTGVNEKPVAKIAAALRSFASPPEPEAIGSVAVDSAGNKWVRISDAADDNYMPGVPRESQSPPWRRRGAAAKWWNEIHVVRVESVGPF